MQLFGQGQAAGVSKSACRTSPRPRDQAGATKLPPSRCAIALGKYFCSAWEIWRYLQMDAELSSCWFQGSPKRQGEVDAGNLSPVIVLFCLSDI